MKKSGMLVIISSPYKYIVIIYIDLCNNFRYNNYINY